MGNPVAFPEFYWINGAHPFSARFTPSAAIQRLILLLFSPHRGIFAFSPIAVFGVYGMLAMGRRGLKRVSTLFAMLFLVNMGFSSFWGYWDGGLC